MKSDRYIVLDGFRGLAAIMVAIYHLDVVGNVSNANLIKNSYLFVEFFFVLSGFVISHSYLNRLQKIGLLDFFKRRVARIWPLHFFMTLMFVPFAISSIFLNIDFGDRFSLPSFISNVFLLQALNFHDEPTWNLPAWSISVELYTCLIFAFIFMSSTLKKRIVFTSLTVSLSSALVLGALSSMGDVYHLAILRCLYSFFLGVVAYQLHHRIKSNAKIEVFTSFLLFLAMSITYISPTSYLAFLSPVLFMMVVTVFSKESGVISRFLKKKQFAYLGGISYSIYLTHAWIVSSIKSASVISEKVLDYSFISNSNGGTVLDFGLGALNDVIYLPYIALIILVSHLTFKLIERPMQQKINNINFKYKHRITSPTDH